MDRKVEDIEIMTDQELYSLLNGNDSNRVRGLRDLRERLAAETAKLKSEDLVRVVLQVSRKDD